MSKKKNKECRRCTHCCRVIVNIIPMSSASVEWAAARGYKCLDSSEHYLAIEIPSVCPQLKDGACLLEGDKKPSTCREYPSFLKETELAKMGLKRNRIIGNQCGYCTR